MDDLDIILKNASLSSSVPSYVEALNFNSAALKAAIEGVVNNLAIDKDELTIGSDDNPLFKLTTRGVVVRNGGVNVYNGEAELKARLYINGDDESVLIVDQVEASGLIVSTEMELNDVEISDSLTIQSGASLNCVGDAVFSKAVAESMNQYVNSGAWLGVEWDAVESEIKTGVELTKASAAHHYLRVNAQTDPDVYDGTWQVSSGTLVVELGVSDTTPPVNGQVFDISLADVVDNGGASLISNLGSNGIGVVLRPGTGVVFTGGASSVTFNSPDPYKAGVTLQHWLSGDDHVFHIVGVKGASVNY